MTCSDIGEAFIMVTLTWMAAIRHFTLRAIVQVAREVENTPLDNKK